jgi:hypothetical protein
VEDRSTSAGFNAVETFLPFIALSWDTFVCHVLIPEFCPSSSLEGHGLIRLPRSGLVLTGGQAENPPKPHEISEKS